MKSVLATLAAAFAALGLAACAAGGSARPAALAKTTPSAAASSTPAAAAPSANPGVPSPLPTNQSVPGTQVACNMLMRNPMAGQLANTGAPLHVLAKGETSPNVYECQVGLHLTTTFTHGIEGGIYCDYGDPRNLAAAGSKPLADQIYRTALPRTFLIIIGPHTAAAITAFLPGPPNLQLVIQALRAAAGIVTSEGCP